MKKLHIILLAAALSFCLDTSAQSFRSGYFLDNYLYGYRINPAQVNDTSFVSLPLDNIDVITNSNVGISSFLFPGGNGLVTGLNGAVSKEKFLGGLKQNNYVSIDAGVNVFTLGLSNGEQMHTVELNFRALGYEVLPYDLFSLAKSGAAGHYNLGALYSNLSALADLTYGFATGIGGNFYVGGRLHLLLGLCNAYLTGNNSSITLSEQSIALNPRLNMSISGLLQIGTGIDGQFDLSKMDLMGSPFGGFGACVDLGVQYKSPIGLEAMFSLTDLGAISWANSTAVNIGAPINYTGLNLSYKGGSVKTDLEDLRDQLQQMLSYRPEAGTRDVRMLPFNTALGVRYHMPFYENLSVGALATCHIEKYSTWYDARLGATITPGRYLSASGNIGYGSFGPVWGAALNSYIGPVVLALGFDGYIGRTGMIKLYPVTVSVPIDHFMVNAHAGVSILF